MRERFVIAGVVLASALACTPPETDVCRCDAPLGVHVLRAACGETVCLGEVRYLCTGRDTAVEVGPCVEPPRDAGVAIDGGSTSRDAGDPRPRFEVFLDDARLAMVEDVWSAGPRDVWFATAGGRLLRWTGGASPSAWVFPDPLHAVHGTDPQHVWVAGEGGTIANFDGAEGFDRVDTGSTRYAFFDAWGDASTRYVAGELFGAVRRANDAGTFASYGTFQLEDERGNRTSGDTKCVAGTGRGIWVCAEDGLYGYDGSWRRIVAGAPVDVASIGNGYAIAIEATDAWFVDLREVALSGGFGPHGLPRPDGIDDVRGPWLRAVWADAREAWVVGTEGFVARIVNYTDPFAAWERVDAGTDRDLGSIAVDRDSIWIGGDSLILRRAR